MNVPIGSEFEITLEFSPGAGAKWEFVPRGEGVTLLGTEIETASTGIGGGSLVRFRFRAEQRGEHLLEFALNRPWESDTKKTDNRTITVS